MDQESNVRWHALELGEIRLKYHLRQPAPNQWNAVAFIDTPGSTERYSGNTTIVVGVGRTSDEAISDAVASVLNKRSQLDRSRDEQSLPVVGSESQVDVHSGATYA